MTKKERDDLLAVASKEELDELLVKVASECRRLEEELRDLAERPPPHMIQSEIDAERKPRRRALDAYAAYKREIEEKILTKAVASWQRPKW
jgi:hypothetical protein